MGAARSTGSRSSASTNPVAPSRSTTTCGTMARAARDSRAVQPVHQRMSVSVAGPNAASQSRRSSACASAVSSSGTSPFSQLSIGTHRYWPLTQVPRGRPRTSRRSIASCGRTREPTLCVASNRDPTPNRRRFASIGTSFVMSDVNASPRASTARNAAADARVSHAAGRVEIPLSTIIFSSRRRSRTAIVRVQAAYTTGTSSRGTTKSVRRIPRIRTSERVS